MLRSLLNPVFEKVTADSVNTADLQFDTEQPQDVLSSRQPNTWETNDSEYPLYVSTMVFSDGSAGGTVDARPHINTSQTDNDVYRVIHQAADSGNAVVLNIPITFIVPPGHEYKLAVTTGSIGDWKEQKLGNGGD